MACRRRALSEPQQIRAWWSSWLSRAASGKDTLLDATGLAFFCTESVKSRPPRQKRVSAQVSWANLCASHAARTYSSSSLNPALIVTW